MKITSKDKGLLLVVIAFGIMGLSYFFGVVVIREKIGEVRIHKEQLQKEYEDHIKVLEKKDQYQEDIKNYNENYQCMLSEYPASITQENQIVFTAGLEERFNTQIVSVSYTDEAELYTFQSLEKGNKKPYCLTVSTLEIPIELTYSQWKEFLEYIDSYPYKNTMPSVSARFDSRTGIVNAVVTLNQYAIKGENRLMETQDLRIPVGTDSIFLASTPLSYEGARTEQIEEIKKNHTCFIILYPTASDTKAKVIAGAGEAGKLISERNEAETLLLTAEEQNGVCTLKYQLGNQTASIVPKLKGETIDIYILSSVRSSETDLSSVKAEIVNETERTMRIAVVGDDAKQPRFMLEKQRGMIELLK